MSYPSNLSLSKMELTSETMELHSEKELMVLASYQFTGKLDLGKFEAPENLRIRVRQIGGEGVEFPPLVAECPVRKGFWGFRVSERIGLGVRYLEFRVEESLNANESRVLEEFLLPVRIWTSERPRWVIRGIAKYLGVAQFFLFHLIPSSLTQRYSEQVSGVISVLLRRTERKFVRSSLDIGPRKTWETILSPVERIQIWSFAKWNGYCLGHFHHFAPKPIQFEVLTRRANPKLKRPSLSVVTPTLNQKAYLSEAMDSVLGSGVERLFYVVMDGGSSDGSVEEIRKREERLHAWRSSPDGGQASAIREGFLLTEGAGDDVMAYLNSDDLYCPGALEFVLDYFAENPAVDVVYGNRIVVDGTGREVGRWVLPPHDPAVIRLVDFIPQETLFWRRRVYDEVGGIDPDFRFAMDWDLLLRFQAAGAEIRHLDQFLAAFRVHEEQKTATEIAGVGTDEMRILRARENGGTEPLPEDIWDAVRKSQVESWWYQRKR